jgi:hypothetical protein
LVYIVCKESLRGFHIFSFLPLRLQPPGAGGGASFGVLFLIMSDRQGAFN